MKFNEDSRVKIPAVLHLTRLGYQYVSLKTANWDEETNIFRDIFDDAIAQINPDADVSDIKRLYEDILLDLSNDDLGEAFYYRLVNRSGMKLIDFDDFEKNTFHVCTELPYSNGDENFRPDVITLINGMPLAFIEVKKPNNKDGVIDERRRMQRRFEQKKFRKFVNITQLMVYSNNMEYPESQPEPLMGAFYASTAYGKSMFNYFREDGDFHLTAPLLDEDPDTENLVLKDNNLTIIKHSPEFLTNKDRNRPTNRIVTSLFHKDRLQFILKYAIAYVHEANGVQKHIMRYPQIFATKAIALKLDEGLKKGIIWHTQGSGKTALAYYNVRHLTDYYQARGIIPKFYFIVDRIDLMLQAKKEFTIRGLKVNVIQSKQDFAKEIKQVSAIHNHEGKPEITIVNIQKFSDDANVVDKLDYNIHIQRIFFMDEVHRSYNPQGSFLANLQESDPDSIKIGLTGTPLIGDNLKSRDLFGDYIHKYYYNASIADGYTLRLMREDIRSEFKMELEETLRQIEVLRGDLDKRKVYAHRKFVEPMLEYIVNDFEQHRFVNNVPDIGAMVICDSSDQAKEMYEIFNVKYGNSYIANVSMAADADPEANYGDRLKDQCKVRSAILILHDTGDKASRKKEIEDYTEGKVDIVFVYSMLLTGFNAPRLKKLYMGRVVKAHNLLQALTRVNRTYKNERYGYVVDFADIKKEFDTTNKAYFDELQSELGDEMEHYSDLFKSKEEMEAEIEELKDLLWKFETKDLEAFSNQINEIQDKGEMIELVKALRNAKSLYNLIRTLGYYEILDKIDFRIINKLHTIAQSRLDMLNTKDAVENSVETTNLLNIALEEVVFLFKKIGEEELVLAGQLKDILRKTREEMFGNFDKKDPEFTSLYEELERLFKSKNLEEVSQEELKTNIKSLEKIYDAIKDLNRRDRLMAAKYETDKKYARIHKRIMQGGRPSIKERQLNEVLMAVKQTIDDQLMSNSSLLKNEEYFEAALIKIIIQKLKTDYKLDLDLATAKYINNMIVSEYLNEYNGIA